MRGYTRNAELTTFKKSINYSIELSNTFMYGCNQNKSDTLQPECMKYITILTVITLDYI
jgi:hypothetical protein